jgi:hypothetical protein
MHLVGITEVTDCKNARSVKLKNKRVLGGISESKRDEVQKNGDNCMRRSFLICTQQILVGRSNCPFCPYITATSTTFNLLC